MRLHHLNCVSILPAGRTVRMLEQERDDAVAQRTWLDRQRFRPHQWSSQARWRVYRPGKGDGWFGFDCMREFDGVPPELLFVPLPGHNVATPA